MTLIQLALSLISLAVIVVLLAATNSVLLQAVFTLTRLRGWVQRQFVRRWIAARLRGGPSPDHSEYGPVSTIEITLARLSGRRAAAYAYDAPYTQICAQISNASRAAIEVLTSETARRATGDEREYVRFMDATLELLRVFGATAPESDIDRLAAAPENESQGREFAESTSRVLYHVERGIDSLQAAMGAWWAMAVYGFSFVVSVALLGILATDASALRTATLITIGDVRAGQTSVNPSTPWLLLGVVVTLSVFVTPYITRLFERAGRA